MVDRAKKWRQKSWHATNSVSVVYFSHMEKETGYLKKIEKTEHAESMEQLKHQKIDAQLERDTAEYNDEIQRSLHEEKRKAVLKKELKDPMTFTPHGDTLAREEEYRTDWVKKEPEQKQKKSWWKSLGQMFKKTATIGGAALIANSAMATGQMKTPGDSTLGTHPHEKMISKENHEEIPNQIRKDWNNLVDWVDSIGMKGNEALDHNGLGMALIKRYIREHPGTSLAADKETIGKIQLALQEYKEWSLEEVRAKRRDFGPGVTEKNFMANISKTDFIPGHLTLATKFPIEYLRTFESNTIDYQKVANKVLTSDADDMEGRMTNITKDDKIATGLKEVGFAKREIKKTHPSEEVASANPQ